MIKKILLILVGITILATAACSQPTSLQPISAANEAAPSAAAVQEPVIQTSSSIEEESVIPLPDINTSPSTASETDPETLQEEQVVGAAQPAILSSGLSADESAGLLYMREEEKLAHDVYVYLYETWNLAVFQNIAKSEQTHTDSVLALIERYGLSDPAAGLSPGVFNDPQLQELYNQLVAQGTQSLIEALRVGAAIEEIDILDLEQRLAQTDNTDIQRVYTSLESGSRNHLRAFVNSLQNQSGATYAPQYLSQSVYDEIVSTSTGRYGQGSSGQGRQGGRGFGNNLQP